MALNGAFGRIGAHLTTIGGALPRAVPFGLAAVLLVLWCFDLANTVNSRSVENWLGPPRSPMDFAPLASGTVTVVLAVVALRPRSGPALTAGAACATAATVLATSGVLWPLPKGMFGYAFSMSEYLSLFVVLALTALRCRPWQIAVVSLLAYAALLSDYLREPFFWMEQLTSVLVIVAMGLAPGLYLRWREVQRRAYVERARVQERLAIARDLHDVVAHEVTGIVVQTQALRHVADRDPDALRAALPEIEAAGTRALESMRAMVVRLREPGDAPLAPNPSEGLASLAAPASAGRPAVETQISGPVEDLPTDVGTTVLRIAQESVTNALRYARDATRISVVVEAARDEVRVRVYDDGHSGAAPVGGGHGLVGMAERAGLLGGRLSAGPRGHGHGWMVRAWLPLAADPVSAAVSAAGTRNSRYGNEDA